MNKSLFAQYAALNESLKKLEEERDILKAQIVSALTEDNVEKAETDYGTFTRAHRTSWKYTERVDSLAEKLKLAKIKEEQNGKAKPKVSEYLVFTAIKL